MGRAERTPTNLASLTRGILQWAAGRGVEPDHLLRVADIDPHALEDGNARVSRDAHVSLWGEIERLVPDADFGLTSVDGILSASTMGLVGVLAMTSATVEESIARVVANFRLFSDAVVAQSFVTKDRFVLALTPHEVQPRTLADASLASFFHFMRAWTGEPVRVREVFFQHARPAGARDYERVFPCRIHFDQPTNAIAFDREVMALPLLHANPDVLGYLERQAQAKLDELAQVQALGKIPASFTEAVRDAVRAHDPRIGVVARRLGVSTRSLQRSLMNEGLAYRDMVDHARWAIAGPLVASTTTPIEEIAEHLGYADGKAFRRAFRRWSGLSPTEARRHGS